MNDDAIDPRCNDRCSVLVADNITETLDILPHISSQRYMRPHTYTRSRALRDSDKVPIARTYTRMTLAHSESRSSTI